MKQNGKAPPDVTTAEVPGQLTTTTYHPPTDKELKLTKGCVGTAVVASTGATAGATSVADLRKNLRRVIADARADNGVFAPTPY